MGNENYILELSFINPALLSRINRERYSDGVVSDDANWVLLGGERLLLRYQEGQVKLAPGGDVKVLIKDGSFSCVTSEVMQEREIQREERSQELAKKRSQENQEKSDRKAVRILRAQSVNADLGVPVSWVPAIKVVLSGLAENSWGDGTSKRTVAHVMLKEDLNNGRLVRKGGDLLCTPRSGSNGKLWPDSAPGEEVTCKKCLEVAKRWENSPEKILIKALSDGSVDMVREAIKMGVNANIKKEGSLPALTMATDNDCIESVRLLIEAKADVNGVDSEGQTPIMLAASIGNKNIVDLLLGEGAELDIQDCDEYTALMYAAVNGNEECLSALINAGADINIRNDSGDAPVYKAAGQCAKILETAILKEDVQKDKRKLNRSQDDSLGL